MVNIADIVNKLIDTVNKHTVTKGERRWGGVSLGLTDTHFYT